MSSSRTQLYILVSFSTSCLLCLISRAWCDTEIASHLDSSDSVSKVFQSGSTIRHEVQANTFTTSTQSAAAIASGPDGSFTVCWHSRRQQEGTYGIYMQRFVKSGLPVGGEQQVNVFTNSMQMNPAIAIDETGTTWIAWESFGQDGSLNAIIARRFDPVSNLGGDEFLVNQSTDGNQSDVVVAANTDGATFCWVGQSADGKKKRVFSRTFDSHLQPTSDEVVISNSQQHQVGPTVSSSDGSTIVVWSELNRFGQPAGLFGRIINNQSRSNVFSITSKDVSPIEASASVLCDGKFVVVWQQPNGNEYEVFVRKFEQDGSPITKPLRVSIPGSKYVNGATVQANRNDEFVVMWNHQTDRLGKNINISGQLFDAQCQRQGHVFPINVERAGRHRLHVASGKSKVVWGPDQKQLRVAWAGQNEDDSSSVNVTAIVAANQTFSFKKPNVVKSIEHEIVAKPHEPPTFDPALVAKDPFVGFDPLVDTLGPPGTDFGFTAINATGWTPPDPSLAVGPNHIVAMTNGAIVFFDKSGAASFSDQIEGAGGFWGAQGATGLVFDPEVLFDPHSQRFFAMANERGSGNRSYFLIAVSDDDNPNGSWHRYRLDVTDVAAPSIDSPNMGIDEDVVYLTADFFSPDRFLVYMLRKSDLLVGDPVVDSNLLITGSQSYGVPLMYDTNTPAFYMIQAFEFGNFNSIRLHAITDPLNNPQRMTTDVSVPSYGHPQDPPQQGTSSRPELFESRFWSCVYRNGSMWAVHHHSPNSTGTARARWYEFAMNGWPTSGQTPQLVQSGELTPDNQSGQMSATFFPSIWVDELGNAAITTARSSNSEFISMSRAVRSFNDPLGTFQEVQLVKPSTTSSTTGRWGDYSATASDPSEPGAFWGFHEYTQSTGSWLTYISKYVVEPATISYPPSSITAKVGEISSGTVADLAESDDVAVAMLAGIPSQVDEGEIVAMLGGNIIENNLEEFTIVLEASVNSPNVEQTIELFNFSNGKYEVIDTRVANLNDTVVEIDVSGGVFEYSTPAAGTWIARVSFKAVGPTIFFPWEAKIDQFVWRVEN